MLFSATQTRKVEDLARISLRKEPLYVGVDDKNEVATADRLEFQLFEERMEEYLARRSDRAALAKAAGQDLSHLPVYLKKVRALPGRRRRRLRAARHGPRALAGSCLKPFVSPRARRSPGQQRVADAADQAARDDARVP